MMNPPDNPPDLEHTLRAAVVRTAQALDAHRLNSGSAGNVSVRWQDGMLITPSGVPADALTCEQISRVDGQGTASGPLPASSEWRFHLAVYRQRAEAGAVVHCHSPFATALACQRREIPPFHYMIARFGGDTVRCADYATFGTQALSDSVLRALSGRSACLMANHGMLVFGTDAAHALATALELETLCEQYWRSCQLGPPSLLDAAEMQRVIERFRHYGQPLRHDV